MPISVGRTRNRIVVGKSAAISHCASLENGRVVIEPDWA